MDTPQNVSAETDDARESGGFPIGCRVTTDDLRRIDLAKVYGNYRSRADFIEAAVLEKTERVLAAQAVVDRPTAG